MGEKKPQEAQISKSPQDEMKAAKEAGEEYVEDTHPVNETKHRLTNQELKETVEVGRLVLHELSATSTTVRQFVGRASKSGQRPSKDV